MDTKIISKYQPVGDAASELREVIPGLDQMMAVSILRTVERGFGPFSSDDGYTVTHDDMAWTVTDCSAGHKVGCPHDYPGDGVNEVTGIANND